jgi:preprotein translocase subunit SecG
VAMVMAVVLVVVTMIVVVVMIVLVMLAHASIPVAGSAMCSNMVESRLLMWASAAA